MQSYPRPPEKAPASSLAAHCPTHAHTLRAHQPPLRTRAKLTRVAPAPALAAFLKSRLGARSGGRPTRRNQRSSCPRADASIDTMSVRRSPPDAGQCRRAKRCTRRDFCTTSANSADLLQLRAQSYAVSHACATGCDTLVHKAATASAGRQSRCSMPAPSFSDFCSQARPMALAYHPDVARNVWEVIRSFPKSRYFAPHLR